MRTAARENRAFLGRAVRYLAEEAGITQFLDTGSGLPGVGNVHEVAQQANPAARVVYVDRDRCEPGCAHARRADLHASPAPKGTCHRGPADRNSTVLCNVGTMGSKILTVDGAFSALNHAEGIEIGPVGLI